MIYVKMCLNVIKLCFIIEKIIFSKVVLPEPLMPTKPIFSPFFTVKERLSSTGCFPFGKVKDMLFHKHPQWKVKKVPTYPKEFKVYPNEKTE